MPMEQDEQHIGEPKIMLERPSREHFTATNESPTFEYDSIEEDEIRLITLLPAADRDDPVECLVSKYQRSENAAYAAVSYTWGDLNRTAVITCNGRKLEVTANCEAALRSWRSSKNPETLWIDAICINQKDIAERNAQVAQMGDVFRLARETLAFLGDSERHYDFSDDDSSDDLDLLLASPWFRRSWIIQEVLFSKDITVFIGDARISWHFLMSLCRRVMPHGHLPRLMHMRNDMVHDYGMRPPESWNMNTGDRTIGPIKRGESSHQGTNSSSMPKKDDSVPASVLSHPDAAAPSLSSSVEKLPLMSSEPSDSTAKESGQINLNYWRLLSFMYETRNFECRDPRDKLFAILPLFSRPIPELIRPDYSKGVKEVFKDLAWFIIQQDLPDCLNYASKLLNPKLPSWVTDWGRRPQKDGLIQSKDELQTRGPWRAGFSSGRREIRATRLGQNTISLRGRIVTTVTMPFRSREFLLSLGLNGCQSQYNITVQVVDCRNSHTRPVAPPYARYDVVCLSSEGDRTRADDLDAFIFKGLQRAVVEFGQAGPIIAQADERNVTRYQVSIESVEQGYHGLDRAQQVLRKSLSDAISAAYEGKDDVVLKAREVESFGHPTSGRCCAVTEHAVELGTALVPATVANGDRICILLGFQTPFLMRPAGNRWRVLGECWFPTDIMYGALVNDFDWSTIWSEVPDSRLVDFQIY